MIRAAVLGSPIAHSLSPALHMAAYKHLGITGEYTAIEVLPADLKDFIDSRDSSWTGFSLTMPLKESVMSIADVLDPLVVQVACANTLIRKDDSWSAYSTDVSGFRHSILNKGAATCKSVSIIGSGATARAAAAAVDETGRVIHVVHRNPDRCQAMKSAAPKSEIIFHPWESALPMADITINTTPSGAADVFVHTLSSKVHGIFFEALYKPWPTPLLAKWRSLGGESIDGLDLLVHQGVDQISLMTGIECDHQEFAQLLRKIGLAQLNI